MTRKEWDEIKAAAELLGLGEKATLTEIKKAYRRMSKKCHPDLHKRPECKTKGVAMHKLTEAYERLVSYCTAYCFPLIPSGDEQLEGEDWWLERFGQDHLWGRDDGEGKDAEK